MITDERYTGIIATPYKTATVIATIPNQPSNHALAQIVAVTSGKGDCCTIITNNETPTTPHHITAVLILIVRLDSLRERTLVTEKATPAISARASAIP